MCFTVTSSFWLRPFSFFLIPLYWEGSTSSPDQLPGEHTGLPSHVEQCLPVSSFRATHLLTHSYLVGRSIVVWHILMVHNMFFNVHQSHRHDGTHHSLLMSWGALWWGCFLTCVITVPEGTWAPNTVVRLLGEAWIVQCTYPLYHTTSVGPWECTWTQKI